MVQKSEVFKKDNPKGLIPFFSFPTHSYPFLLFFKKKIIIPCTLFVVIEINNRFHTVLSFYTFILLDKFS